MATIQNFEELKCWKSARALTKEIYISTSEGEISKDFGLKNQIRRATLSIMNNIAEGFGRYSKKELIRFLDIAQSSAAEVKSMLYVIEDLEYLEKKEIVELHHQVDKTRALCRGFIAYIKKQIH